MGLSEFFGFTGAQITDEIPDIFPIAIRQTDFVTTDMVNTYLKILTDVVERTHGLAEQYEPALWDNCLKSESGDGLITLLAKAMAEKKDLFVVYDKPTEVLREATGPEAQIIREDYAKSASSNLGIYISFKNYMRSDMLRFYSAIEYCTVGALYKSMNVSKAVQLKINDLRASVGLVDSANAKNQAFIMATALKEGRDIFLDAKDSVETTIPDLSSVNAAMEFLNEKRAFYLAMPCSYLTGEAPAGLGDSGIGDAKAVERGLKNYYFSIIRPVLKALFDVTTTFKSQDFGQLTAALDAAKTFSLIDEQLISMDNKTMIINKLFDLDDDAKGDPPPKVDPLLLPDPSAKPKTPFNG